MLKPGHNYLVKIQVQKQIRTFKTTEKLLQAKPTAMSIQLRQQRTRALQTAENAPHVGFEEWKGSLSVFSS